MTLIAVSSGVMCADSASFQGDLMFPSPGPKIVRAPDGSLVGANGATGCCAILRHWASAGMNFDTPPKFSFTQASDNDSILWLWLKPDGTVHMGDCTMNNWAVPDPTIIGYGSQYAYGLLDARIPLAEAVRRTIERVPYLGGDVQIERLGGVALRAVE